MFREVVELERVGRLKFHTQAEYVRSFDTLVGAGKHVLVDPAINLRSLVALDFSKKGDDDSVIDYIYNKNKVISLK